DSVATPAPSAMLARRRLPVVAAPPPATHGERSPVIDPLNIRKNPPTQAGPGAMRRSMAKPSANAKHRAGFSVLGLCARLAKRPTPARLHRHRRPRAGAESASGLRLQTSRRGEPMQMSGEYRIEAPRTAVWQALNDPEVLKACIPGCESLEKSGDNQFDATVRAKVGPVSAKFNGSVTLSDIVEAESYTISGTGKGGAAGMATGGAKVRLSDASGGTLLNYDVEAKVSGKIAQIGARLIDSTAKKYADDFFAKFRE